MTTSEDGQHPNETKPPWQPLSPRQRRVLGVLVEKAKTTPDGYPMSLNALTNGCNQKSNRSPLTSLKPEEVDDVLDELRALGAVAEVQGGGRVPKYRHYAYDWLGVDKQEIAVLAELMLRGEQSVGELRTRASRMQAIPDMAALRPVLDSLKQKKLLIELTSPGRGQVVTHGLYKQRELDDLRGRFASSADTGSTPRPTNAFETAPRQAAASNEVAELRSELEELRDLVQQLQNRIEQIESSVGT